LATPPFLSLNPPLGDEVAQIKFEAVADSKLLTTDDTRSPPLASEGRINEVAAHQQLSIEPTRQRSPIPSPRPSLRIVIPGSSHQEPWLGGPLFGSPLSGSGTDAPSPSVLLNAHAVRTYLDVIHGPHPLPPEPGSLLLSLSPSKLVTDHQAEQVSPKHLTHHEARTILPSPFPLVSTKQISGSKSGAMAIFPSTWPGFRVYQPQPMYPTKRRASLGIIAAVRGSSKRPRLIPRP